MSANNNYEDEEFEVTVPRVRPDSISNMGQLLLQGYAMLADACETCGVGHSLYNQSHCHLPSSCNHFFLLTDTIPCVQIPLMRKPNSNEVICVNCGGDGSSIAPSPPLANGIAHPHPDIHPSSTNHEIDNESTSEEEIEAAPEPLRERITTPASNASHPSVDSSQALADKMLEGWTLMAEHCPRCATPLVRSKEGRIYCVSCEMYALREADLPTQTQQQTQQATTGTHAIEASPSAQEQAAQPEKEIIELQKNRLQKPNLSVVSGEYEEHLKAGSSAVAARLASSATRLSGASAAETSAILSEIQSCVEVLRGIQGILRD